MLFCLTLLVAVPGLYALGDWLGGTPLAIGLPALSTLATLLYAGRGGGPTLPPGAQPPGPQPG